MFAMQASLRDQLWIVLNSLRSDKVFSIDPARRKLGKVSVLWHQHHMLDIKFNAETPKCEFSSSCSCSAVDTFKILRQKINETDINSRRLRIHMGEPQMHLIALS